MGDPQDRVKQSLMRLKSSAMPYLEEDEDGQRRVSPDRSLARDATAVREREPERARISGILPTARAAPPGGWVKHFGVNVPREGSFRVNVEPSRNVEYRKPRGIGALLRRIVS